MDEPAAQLRPGWLDIPTAVRSFVTERIGARVLGWTTLPGASFPGGYELQLQAGGVNYYVKAADGHNPVGYRMLRAELDHLRALPPKTPVPSLEWVLDQEIDPYGRWLVLGFTMRPTRLPDLPWRDDDVAAALGLAHTVGDIAVSAPGRGGADRAAQDHDAPALRAWPDRLDTESWARLAADHPDALSVFGTWLPARTHALHALGAEAVNALPGDRLAHHLLRREIIGLPTDRDQDAPLVTNWALCAAGPAFASTLSLLGFIQAQGGPAPEEALRLRPLPSSYDDDEITAYLAVLAGHHILGSLQPPDPYVPITRAAEREHAKALADWLRRRLGW